SSASACSTNARASGRGSACSSGATGADAGVVAAHAVKVVDVIATARTAKNFPDFMGTYLHRRPSQPDHRQEAMHEEERRGNIAGRPTQPGNGTMLARGLTKRCPLCAERDLFGSWLRMRDH